MRTKQLLIGCMTAGMIWGFTAAAWAGDRFDKRQDKQTDRIYQGVRNGKISPREYERLNQEQWRIEVRRKKALKDGHLSRKEKRVLERMQDKAGRNIYRAKHNSLQKKKAYFYNDRIRKPNPAPYCRY